MLCRRDWSSLISVDKIAFSPYTSPACYIHEKSKEREKKMRYLTLVSLLSTFKNQKCMKGYTTMSFASFAHCNIFFRSSTLASVSKPPWAASSLAFSTDFSFISTSLMKLSSESLAERKAICTIQYLLGKLVPRKKTTIKNYQTAASKHAHHRYVFSNFYSLIISEHWPYFLKKKDSYSFLRSGLNYIKLQDSSTTVCTISVKILPFYSKDYFTLFSQESFLISWIHLIKYINI